MGLVCGDLLLVCLLVIRFPGRLRFEWGWYNTVPAVDLWCFWGLPADFWIVWGMVVLCVYSVGLMVGGACFWGFWLWYLLCCGFSVGFICGVGLRRWVCFGFMVLFGCVMWVVLLMQCVAGGGVCGGSGLALI